MTKMLALTLKRPSLFHYDVSLYYTFTLGHVIAERSVICSIVDDKLYVTMEDVLVKQFLTFCYQKQFAYLQVKKFQQ